MTLSEEICFALLLLYITVSGITCSKSSFKEAVWGSSTPADYVPFYSLTSQPVSHANQDFIEGTQSSGEETTNNQKVRFKNRGRGGWSAWSDWSVCSRPCDGGVSRQLRRCSSVEGCRGDPVRYKICNMQPCSDGIDFRARQCSAFDQVPYEGALLKWIPHYEEMEPCALTCRGKPNHHHGQEPQSPPILDEESSEMDDETTVVAQLAARVQDGTRCRLGSLDMCINGKCQRVGCDLKIGSNKRVDECGVCGGDGSSCARPLYQWDLTPMSLCSVTCGGGYRMSRPVCRNRVSGADVDEQLCNASQKPEPAVQQCSMHPCPPKWLTGEWTECSVSCGGGSRARRVECAVQSSNGTIKLDNEEACVGVKPRDVEPCAHNECPTWTTGPWSGCSVSCGSGVQVRGVQCNDPMAAAGMGACPLNEKPPSQRSCSTGIICPIFRDSGAEDDIEDLIPGVVYHTQPLIQKYPLPQATAERLIGEQVVPSEATFIKDADWGPCSVTCGEGKRRREVHCKIFLEFSRTIAKLPDYKCSGPKPQEEVERCVMEPCSMAYGSSMNDYNSPALYPSDTYSNGNIRVAPGTPGKSYSWKEQGYTHCSASCLGGVQTLIVNCVRDDTQKLASPYMCDRETKPESIVRTCNEHPCPPRWNYSDFSPCSKSCGIGMQTREVTCIHEVTQGGTNTIVVPSSMCPQPPPPDRQYCNVLDCPVRWHVSEWSKCSKECGEGVRERKVECKQTMAQSHIVERVESSCPPNKPPSSKPCHNKNCVVDNSGPIISMLNTTFIQTKPEKKTTVQVGGSATVFQGTQVKIKCPVKGFNKTQIVWTKDRSYLPKTKKYKVSKKGALRIQDVKFHDSGIYTCIAGKSSADLNLVIKQRPGEFPSSEEIEKQKIHPQNDPNDSVDRSDGRWKDFPFLPGSEEDHSHEQKPDVEIYRQKEKIRERERKEREREKERRERERDRQRYHITTPQIPERYNPQGENGQTDDDYDKEFGSGNHGEDPVPSQMSIAGDEISPSPTSSASRHLPIFLKFITYMQLLWPFRVKSQTRYEAVTNNFDITPTAENTTEWISYDIKDDLPSTDYDLDSEINDTYTKYNYPTSLESNSVFTDSKDYTTEDKISGLRLSTFSDEGMSTFSELWESGEDIKVEWVRTDWSKCSLTCGGGGFQMRAAQCMLRIDNNTQNVESSFCENKGLKTPETIQKCGSNECPHWEALEWTVCSTARCFDWNTAMQRREVQCIGSTSLPVADNLCDQQLKPPHRQECYNDKCKGVWRTDNWSECGGQCGEQGARYRILRCVWFGTKRPAGSACRHRPRPAVVKPCQMDPCPNNQTDCRDVSKFCQNVRAMNMCRVPRYQLQCCYSCKKH